MEILYPDVVGSGGAPKRIMKPKRKGPDAIPGSDDPDMPGTAVLDLHVDSTFRSTGQKNIGQSRSTHDQTANTAQQQRPTSTTIPPRTHISNSSALTPPEETATHTRKRFMPPPSSTTAPAPQTSTGSAPQATQVSPEKRRRISNHPSHHTATVASSSDATAASTATAGKALLEECFTAIAEALKVKSTPRWSEQAMEIFFRDFPEEDMDLQLKIAKKALLDENEAMVFCKMPAALRKHWVKRLREVHNNRVA
jgi:hypothetical protein